MSFGFGFGPPRAPLRGRPLGAAIRSLFAANEPGVWYDPSDFSTLFQDTAGTKPVTDVEQPVGLMLDKSRGLVRGPELVTNGTFDTDLSGWTGIGGATATVVSGVLQLTAGATAGGRFQDITTLANSVLVSVQVRRVSGSGSLNVWGIPRTGGFNSPNTQITVTSSDWTTVQIVVHKEAGASGVRVYLQALIGDGVFEIDNISVRELPGNHATQLTATSRPVLSARYNLLEKTHALDADPWKQYVAGTGKVPVVTQNADIAPDGTMTATRILLDAGEGGTPSDRSMWRQFAGVSLSTGVSYTSSVYIKAATAEDIGKRVRVGLEETLAAMVVELTDEWQLFTNTYPRNVGSAFVFEARYGYGWPVAEKAEILVWRPDLRVANNGVNLPPYQRVNTATDYDTEGFPYYLYFDGVDDWLVTNTITPGIDKVQVFAGVRKLSDAAFGAFVELSADPFATDGSFGVAAPWATSSPTYLFRSRGTAVSNASFSGAASPTTNVLTGIGDIPGDSAILRVNGTQAASSIADQGTGNYGNHPLYIGRRGGATLPFNGHLYSLIVRFGSNLPDATLERVERFINSKTRAY